MDFLDNYKKVWSHQPTQNKQISIPEIYKLAHSKSSSIVKWIFIIGILEFVFWTCLNFLVPDSFYKIYEDLNLNVFLNFFMGLHYIVIVAFIFLFYKNYKKISLADNTKKLIKDILKIRKTVNYYVYYNLITAFLISLLINITLFSDTERLIQIMKVEKLSGNVSQIITITALSQLVALIIILTILWLFYKLIYGILLKKLSKNYKELSRLDDID